MRRRVIESLQRTRIACRRPRAAGFTLLEILVVVAVLGLIAVLVIESMAVYVPRYRLRNTASQVVTLINKARLEAIRRGVTTVVAAEYADRSITAFAELNGDPNNPLTPGARYLVYDPDPISQPDRTDYLIGYVTLPGARGAGVQFGGPVNGIEGADAIVGLTPVPGALAGEPPVLVFQPTGAVDAPGALRFTDNGLRNFLETTVATLTGKTEIRKYLLDVDSPTGTAAFFAEGNESFGAGGVGKNVWVWY